jgi:hypothetical protein
VAGTCVSLSRKLGHRDFSIFPISRAGLARYRLHSAVPDRGHAWPLYEAAPRQELARPSAGSRTPPPLVPGNGHERVLIGGRAYGASPSTTSDRSRAFVGYGPNSWLPARCSPRSTAALPALEPDVVVSGTRRPAGRALKPAGREPFGRTRSLSRWRRWEGATRRGWSGGLTPSFSGDCAARGVRPRTLITGRRSGRGALGTRSAGLPTVSRAALRRRVLKPLYPRRPVDAFRRRPGGARGRVPPRCPGLASPTLSASSHSRRAAGPTSTALRRSSRVRRPGSRRPPYTRRRRRLSDSVWLGRLVQEQKALSVARNGADTRSGRRGPVGRPRTRRRASLRGSDWPNRSVYVRWREETRAAPRARLGRVEYVRRAAATAEVARPQLAELSRRRACSSDYEGLPIAILERWPAASSRSASTCAAASPS